MRRTSIGLVAAALAVAGVAPPGAAATVKIEAFGAPGSFHWHPDVRRIVSGDRARWVNSTDANHTVTAYRGAWKKNVTLEPGASTGFAFKKAGTYKFRCTIHSSLSATGTCTGMCGTIKARPPS